MNAEHFGVVFERLCFPLDDSTLMVMIITDRKCMFHFHSVLVWLGKLIKSVWQNGLRQMALDFNGIQIPNLLNHLCDCPKLFELFDFFN